MPSMKPTIRYVIALGLAIVLSPRLFGATGTISPSPYQLVLDNNGNPASLACIWTYTAGTSSPVATYTDVGLTVANANPIIASTAGRFTAFLTSGVSYKFLYELAPCSSISHGTTLLTADNIAAVPLSSASLDVTGTVGESVTAGQAVYLSDGSGGKSAGQWYKADSTNTYSSSLLWVGMAPVAISSGVAGAIRVAGSVTGLAGLTIGAKYYVSAAGAITTTAPTNTRVIGQADSTTSLVLNANPPPDFAAALTNHGVLLGQGVGVSPIATAVMTTGQLLVGVTGADPAPTAPATAGASMVLLKANSGTDTGAGAVNVDTIALTGLTAKDRLIVWVGAVSVTQATAGLLLYNSTDGVTLVQLDAGSPIAAGETLLAPNANLEQSQASNVTIWGFYSGRTSVGARQNLTIATVTQIWTGTWTLALRHTGVTAGGTLQWKWAVYKVLGQ